MGRFRLGSTSLLEIHHVEKSTNQRRAFTLSPVSWFSEQRKSKTPGWSVREMSHEGTNAKMNKLQSHTGSLPFVSRLSCWAWNHAGVYTCMHMASRTRIVAAGSMPGTTSSYHDVIIWGPPFCISCELAKCSMFHERWRLCHFQNL